MCLGVGLFASILFGTLCASWIYVSISFTKLGKFCFTTFSNRFPISGSVSSPSGAHTPIWCECWTSWNCPRGCLYYPHFFGLFSCCSGWLVFASLYSKSLIWFSASSILLLFPCKLFFTSVSVSLHFGKSKLIIFKAVLLYGNKALNISGLKAFFIFALKIKKSSVERHTYLN